MTYEFFLALAGFAFAASVTPGPNNLMILASGANFGVRRSLPHLLGIGLGFAAMVGVVGLGLGRAFDIIPALRGVLVAVSVVYLLWLAWKIATAAPPTEAPETAGRPFTFLQAAAFQWVNPKAWTMALTAVTLYAAAGAIGVALVFAAVGLPSVAVWLLLGSQMARVLTSPARLRWFNRAMAALLVASLWPTLAPLLGAIAAG